MTIRPDDDAGDTDRAHPTMNRWRDWLGLNSSTMALLGAITLVTAATELWNPLIPQYLKVKQTEALAEAGDDHGADLARHALLIITVGLYGFYRDLLEAVNYYFGGVLAGRLNTRRSLLLFNVLPLLGLGLILTWQTQAAVFLAIPFIFVWDSIAGPATITVVGDALPPDRRTMAFSLQAIFRRVARITAGLLSAPLIWLFGRESGVHLDMILAIGLILLAAALQFRYMRTASRDAKVVLHQPRRLLRRFSPDLKRLLLADIFARWAEGVAGVFIILYCVPILSRQPDVGTAVYQSLLLNIQYVTNMVLYLVIGPLASREGLAKKPYIGLTFLFFALFPLSLAVLGQAWGAAGLAAAFVIGGFREIGEPARKAMIADLVPADVRTQAIGLYWSVRSLAVMAAAPAGAAMWLIGDHIRPGTGSLWMLVFAGAIGMIGALLFYVRFGKDRGPGAAGQLFSAP